MTFSEMQLIYFHKLVSWDFKLVVTLQLFIYFNFSFSKWSRAFLVINSSLYISQQCLFLNLMFNLPKMTWELGSQRTISKSSPFAKGKLNDYSLVTDLKHPASHCRSDKRIGFIASSIHSSPLRKNTWNHMPFCCPLAFSSLQRIKLEILIKMAKPKWGKIDGRRWGWVGWGGVSG